MSRMVQKISLGILFFIFSFFIWYLFVKPNDFEVVINVKTSPGTVYQNILGWNKGLNKGKTTTVFSAKHPFTNLKHSYTYESYRLGFDWNMKQINDSITKVCVGINDLDRSLVTRLEKLVGISNVEKLIRQELIGFNTELVAHLDQFKVSIDGVEKSPETSVAYVSISCEQNEKAAKMIQNSTYIHTFLKENDLTLLSNPFVEILDWNKSTGQMSFNFCFPIATFDNFPEHKEIRYKKVEAKESLKATFYGNYAYTDNAWYALYQHSLNKKIKPLKTITEVYYNNPHTDVKDATWAAAIYMQIE